MTGEEFEKMIADHESRINDLLDEMIKSNEIREKILQQDAKQLKLYTALSIVIFLMMLANGFMTLKIHMGW